MSFLGRLTRREERAIARILRQEVVGGALLLVAAVVAIGWANSPWRDSYAQFLSITFGPTALDLRLSVNQWAADGLLAVFFFVAGLELKRELAVGSLRRRAEAVLPVAAALGGMVLPALIYTATVNAVPGAGHGWGIPMATDIAFALAVLAIAGRGLPSSLRAFLLTLAVVDDLGAITVIAIFYSADIRLWPLFAALALIVLYIVMQRRRLTSTWLYLPLALTVWTLMHASGVHATVAGVLLGLATRVVRDDQEKDSPAERLEHRLRPWSAGVCVPIFALCAAGVTVVGTPIATISEDPVTRGVVFGLVAGKFLGIFGTTWLVARVTRARLSPDLAWSDIAGLSLVAGIGFTVSLLIAELSFVGDPLRTDNAKIGVLIGSVLAAVIGSAVLALRRRALRVSPQEQEAS
ncbi:MAG TPA: Na+/H+ antiporter NhaA [Actinobacteria bacterium]|nr:Na+/H+ antiporter NhaA [Actinomycetota bacterium]